MKISGYDFTDPVPLGSGYDCSCAGVYFVLKDNGRNNWGQVYVGQTKDAKQRLDSGHHKWDCFHKHASRPYVAFYEMPNSSEVSRKAVENVLVEEWDPPCND